MAKAPPKVLNRFLKHLESAESHIYLDLAAYWGDYNRPDDEPMEELPVSIGEFRNVKVLTLTFNRLFDLPKELANLENLEELNASHNAFKKIPDAIAHLHNLQNLDLSSCNISEIPDFIAKMKALKKLNLNGNPVTEAPDSLKDKLPPHGDFELWLGNKRIGNIDD